MKDMFEQWQASMEKSWTSWQNMIKDSAWMHKPEIPFQGKWSSWVGTMRSAYEVNLSWWQTFMDQGEEAFFRMFKESPIYNSDLEGQMREFWNVMKKAQNTLQQTTKEQFEKMEALLKEQEEGK